MDEQLRHELDDLQLSVRELAVQGTAMNLAVRALLAQSPEARDMLARFKDQVDDKSLFQPIPDEQIAELKSVIERLIGR